MKMISFLLAFGLFLGSRSYAIDNFGTALNFSETNGHIDIVGSSIDSSRLEVAVEITCYQGWGDGQQICGNVKSRVPVDSKGYFHFAGIKGKNANYFGFTYKLFLDGQPLIGSPYRVDTQKEVDEIQSLFQAMSLVVLEPYSVHLSTVNGQDFSAWNATFNKNSPQSYRLRLEKTTGQDWGVLLPDNYINVRLNSPRDMIPRTYFLLPGPKNRLAQDYLIRTIVDSCDLCVYKSINVYDKKWPLDFSNLIENISELKLDTDKVSFSIDGSWNLFFSMSFYGPDGRYFTHSDPQISMQARCVNGALEGTIFYQYIRNNGADARLNHADPLSGLCSPGQAKAKVRFVMLYNYLFESIARDIPEVLFDDYFYFDDIRGDALTLRYATPSGKDEDQSAQRCVNGFAPNSLFNHCP